MTQLNSYGTVFGLDVKYYLKSCGVALAGNK